MSKAPAKIILLGEHSVVYGFPALAMPVVERTAEAAVEINDFGAIRLEAEDIGESWTLESAGSSRLTPLADLAVAALQRFGAPPAGLTARFRSTIPVGAGMGSSAALAVALIRAIASALNRPLTLRDITELAMLSEKGFHANPSGLDVQVIAREEAVYFLRQGTCETVRPQYSDFLFVIANTGKSSSTAEVVRDVAEAYKRDAAAYDAIFRQLGELAASGMSALRTGTPAELGPLLTRAHRLLRRLGVSSPELDGLVDAAIAAGATGAKLTGAGRGGHIIAAIRSRSDERRVREALRSAGALDACTARLERVRQGKP